MYRVTIDMTFEEAADRDKLYDEAVKVRAKVSRKASGRVERHTCNHDKSQPCVDQEVTAWEAAG